MFVPPKLNAGLLWFAPNSELFPALNPEPKVEPVSPVAAVPNPVVALFPNKPVFV